IPAVRRDERPTALLQESGDHLEHGILAHGDLDIDDVLRAEPRHRRGTDVIDTSRTTPEDLSQPPAESLERIAPPRIGVEDPHAFGLPHRIPSVAELRTSEGLGAGPGAASPWLE